MAVLILAPGLRPAHVGSVALLALCMGILGGDMTAVGMGILWGTKRFGTYAASFITTGWTYAFAMLFAFHFWGLTPASACLIWGLSRLLDACSLLACSLYRTRLGRPDRALLRQSLRFGIRSAAGELATSTNARADQSIMGAISPEHELGLYAVAVNAGEVLLYLPNAVGSAIVPNVVEAEHDELEATTTRAFRMVFGVTTIAVVAAAIVGFLLIPVVFGSKFHGSIAPFLLLLPGAWGYAAQKVFSSALTGLGQPGRSSLGPLTALLTGLALDVVLIPPYGAQGAAGAASAAFIAGRHRRAGRVPHGRALPPGLAGAHDPRRPHGRRCDLRLPRAAARAGTSMTIVRLAQKSQASHARPSPPSSVSDEQDLRRYIRLLQDQWRLAAGIVVVCVLVAVAVAMAQPSRYRATASLLFLPAQAPSLNTQTNADPACSILDARRSRRHQAAPTNASQVSHIPLQTLRDSVHSNSSINGDLIDVSASAPSAQKAAARANAVANALVRVRQTQAQDAVRSSIAQLRQQIDRLGSKAVNATAVATARGNLAQQQSLLALTKGDVELVEPARCRASPPRPDRALNAAVGFLVGLLARRSCCSLATASIAAAHGVELESSGSSRRGGDPRCRADGHVPPATVTTPTGRCAPTCCCVPRAISARAVLVTSADRGRGQERGRGEPRPGVRGERSPRRRGLRRPADALRSTSTWRSQTSPASPRCSRTTCTRPTRDAGPAQRSRTPAARARSTCSRTTRVGRPLASLGSHAMQHLLGDLQDEYDIVVIDAPGSCPRARPCCWRGPGDADARWSRRSALPAPRYRACARASCARGSSRSGSSSAASTRSRGDLRSPTSRR